MEEKFPRLPEATLRRTIKALLNKVSTKTVEDLVQGFGGMIYEPPLGKTNNVVSEQVQHKLSCTSTEKCSMLEISDLRRRGTVLSE